MQTPDTQAWPEPHARPQAPQLPLSEVRLRHTFEQLVWPAGHTQLPPEQLWPAPQARPQAPQLLVSVERLRQADWAAQ